MSETATMDEQTTDTSEEPAVDTARKSPEELFKFSTWCHVGPGAEECEAIDEANGVNECANPLHFHAWCRLPNQFQHREIREKALAAKARRVRQLRDPETDAYAILEDELDQLARAGDEIKEDLVDELVAREWWKDYLEAGRDVRDGDEDADSEFEHIERDRERIAELMAMDSDARPADELGELQRHVEEYNALVDARHKELMEPRRVALRGKDVNALIDLVRDDRISQDGNEVFMHIYATWMWLVGSYSRPQGVPRFTSLEHMQQAAPEVIAALKETYDDLERTMNEEVSGNS